MAQKKQSRFPSTSRSRITNGKRLADSDGRSAAARRQRDVYLALQQSAKGCYPWSPHKDEMARRASALVVLAERYEARLIEGDSGFEDLYLRSVGALRRLLADLGGLEISLRDDDGDEDAPKSIEQFLKMRGALQPQAEEGIDYEPEPPRRRSEKLKTVKEPTDAR